MSTNRIRKTAITMPLGLTWSPKEDITTYELALSLHFLNRLVMPYEFSKNAPYARHFEVHDPNQ